MRQITDLSNDDWGAPKKGTYPLPCQAIENLTYDYSEVTGNCSRNQSRSMVLVHFPNSLKYRQITHVQEYDVESLVGNIGGYIGLFLGYSLLHFPRFVISLFDVIKKKLVPGIKVIRRNAMRRKSKPKTEINVNPQPYSDVNETNQRATLKNVRNELTTLARRIDEVESQMLSIEEGRGCLDKSMSTKKCSIKMVRVTEWHNVPSTPHYI